MSFHPNIGPIYAASFSASALTTNAQDVFGLLAPTNSRVAIREIKFGQYSDAGDAQAEMLSVILLRGSTISSTSTAISPTNVKGWSAAPTAGSSVTSPCTTLAYTTSASWVHADTFNAMAGWRYYPVPEERIVLEASQRLHVRITAPNDALTINGTILFEELGKPAST
jgi:hypothetical protein